MVTMNRLTTAKRKAVIAALTEGSSIRSTVRMAGVAKNTVTKLLVDIGQACEAFHNERVRGLRCRRVECDEIWAFVYCKAKTVPFTKNRDIGHGDAWTWTAIDPDSKLIVSYLLGLRTQDDAVTFMDDLSSRVIDIGQLTTDGFGAYPEAVRMAFGKSIDYAQLIKKFDGEQPSLSTRYSPAVCVGCEKRSVIGFPNPKHISTSIVERSNLTMRMQMRRFTRLTNGFSKKMENLRYALALHFVHYNFCRIHQSLRMTPAMKAGLTSQLYEIEDIIGLLDGVKPN